MIELGPKALAWTEGLPPLDEATLVQIKQLAMMDEVGPHVAVMPDAHWGTGGATVGTVIPTRSVLIPGAVGVDIGCGMTATRTTLTLDDLPDTLQPIYDQMETFIPVGRDQWDDVPTRMHESFRYLVPDYHRIVEKHPLIDHKNLENQLGTLGGGNHFVEISVDHNNKIWVVLHSGSRGVGHRIGQYFITKAKEQLAKKQATLINKDLCFFVEEEPLFGDYLDAVKWAQDFAAANRRELLSSTLMAMRPHLPTFKADEFFVSCHHNYVAKETHFGKQYWITRKGAISAKKGEKGIIPGSMGTSTFIVEGLGNPDSFMSSAHGAGRVLSRGRAKTEITLEKHDADTKHVFCRKDAGVLDESPAAYKNILDVMAAQKELTKPLFELTPLLSLKG